MRVGRHQLRDLIRDVLLEECLLLEGPEDPGTFKAIFMAGAPASGKGSALIKIFGTATGGTSQGLRIVNADILFEYLMEKEGLSKSPPFRSSDDEPLSPEQAEELKQWRSQTSRLQQRALGKVTGGSPGISAQRLGLDPTEYGVKSKKHPGPMTDLEGYIDRRIGIVIDGTATNYGKIMREKTILEDLGYDTMMIAVSVSLQQAKDQNIERASEKEGRLVHVGSLETQWKQQTDNVLRYRSDFANFVLIDNDNPAENAIKQVDRFIGSPVGSVAKDWVTRARAEKSRS